MRPIVAIATITNGLFHRLTADASARLVIISLHLLEVAVMQHLAVALVAERFELGSADRIRNRVHGPVGEDGIHPPRMRRPELMKPVAECQRVILGRHTCRSAKR